MRRVPVRHAVFGPERLGFGPLRDARVPPRGRRARSYRGGMARVGGRNLAMSWIVGIICTAVVAVLLWFALPMGPVMVQFVGDTLRTVMPAEPGDS